MEFRVPEWKNLPAYWEAHCAAFLGEPAPIAKSAREQVAIDRGGVDGVLFRDGRLGRSNHRFARSEVLGTPGVRHKPETRIEVL